MPIWRGPFVPTYPLSNARQGTKKKVRSFKGVLTVNFSHAVCEVVRKMWSASGKGVGQPWGLDKGGNNIPLCTKHKCIICFGRKKKHARLVLHLQERNGPGYRSQTLEEKMSEKVQCQNEHIGLKEWQQNRMMARESFAKHHTR